MENHNLDKAKLWDGQLSHDEINLLTKLKSNPKLITSILKDNQLTQKEFLDKIKLDTKDNKEYTQIVEDLSQELDLWKWNGEVGTHAVGKSSNFDSMSWDMKWDSKADTKVQKFSNPEELNSTISKLLKEKNIVKICAILLNLDENFTNYQSVVCNVLDKIIEESPLQVIVNLKSNYKLPLEFWEIWASKLEKSKLWKIFDENKYQEKCMKIISSNLPKVVNEEIITKENFWTVLSLGCINDMNQLTQYINLMKKNKSNILVSFTWSKSFATYKENTCMIWNTKYTAEKIKQIIVSSGIDISNMSENVWFDSLITSWEFDKKTPSQKTQILKDYMKDFRLSPSHALKYVTDPNVCKEYLAEYFANNNVFQKFKDKINNFPSLCKDYANLVYMNRNSFDGDNLILYKNSESLKKYFDNTQDYEGFSSELLNNKSWIMKISSCINQIYDDNHKLWKSEKEIETNIKQWLAWLSDQELFKSVWDYEINYSITFRNILQEIESRIGNKTYFDYIDSMQIDESQKNIFKNSLILGLFARSEKSRFLNAYDQYANKNQLNQLIINWINAESVAKWEKHFSADWTLEKRYSFSILTSVENFMDNKEFYNQLKGMLNQINSDQFKIALLASLITKWKNKEIADLFGTAIKQDPKWQQANELVTKTSKWIEQVMQKPHMEIMCAYDDDKNGWWFNFFHNDVKNYKTDKNYVEIPTNDPNFKKFKHNGTGDVVSLLLTTNMWHNGNKTATRIGELKKYFPQNLDLLVFRWHNYSSRQFIQESNRNNLINESTIVFDWWCRNTWIVPDYRRIGVKSPMFTYNSTWKWDVTNFYIKELLEFRQKSKWQDLSQIDYSKFLQSMNQNSSIYAQYAKLNISAPWNANNYLLEMWNANN